MPELKSRPRHRFHMRPLRSRLREIAPLRALYLDFRVIKSPRARATLARATLRFVRRNGLSVQTGPFTGLRYPRLGVLRVPGLGARLLGSYEVELHPVIETLIATRPPLVVNIGAPDGYYAVGMALRCERAQVLAYEPEPYRSRVCAMPARMNGVADRVEHRGLCTPESLAAIDAPRGPLRSAIARARSSR
jgi:hypothetical protein